MLADKENANAVIHLFIMTNRELFEKVRGENMIYSSLKELFADDLVAAEAKGEEKGIKIFIEDKIEDGVPKNKILDKLQRKFELTLDKAEEYYKKYSNMALSK